MRRAARTVIRYGGFALGVLLAARLAAEPSTKPASPPAPASRPAGIPVRFDERTGQVRIGAPAAPLVDGLFVEDGNRISPAPAQMIVRDEVQLRGYSGRYPVPVAAAVSGPMAGKAWAVYADTMLDVSPLGPTKLRTLYLWRVLSGTGRSIAVVSLNTAGSSSLYVSSAYVVYADENRKVAGGGPFATFIFRAPADSVTVKLNGEKVDWGKSEKAGATSVPLEKLSRKDLIEWEIADPNGFKGSIHPIVVGADRLMVEYHILSPGDAAAATPATQPAAKKD